MAEQGDRQKQTTKATPKPQDWFSRGVEATLSMYRGRKLSEDRPNPKYIKPQGTKSTS